MTGHFANSVSAYGQNGPRGQQTGYDMIVQASSGLMAMTGTPECNPVKIGTPVVDYATGMSASFAISSALLQRERTGKGQRIDLAMFDVALTLMALGVTMNSYDGHVPGPVGNRGPMPTTGCYETKDGLLMVGASNHRQQYRLWKALGRSDLYRGADELLTVDREPEIKVLSDIFMTRTAAAWEDFLQAHHVPAARVRTMTEALQDPQLEHRRAFETRNGTLGVSRPFKVPIAPFLLAHGGPSVETDPRELGADTESILAELGGSMTEPPRSA